MAIIVNEFEVVDRPPEPPARNDAARPATTPSASETVDLARLLAQIEERRLRVEAH